MGLRDSTAIQQNANDINDGAGLFTKSGVVVSGSWNPTNATVSVMIGQTIPYESPAFNDNGMNQVVPVTCYVVGPCLYDQGGPVGGERVQCWEDEGGWVCLFETSADDSPQAPAGERRIFHRSAKTPNSVVFDSGIQLTNDAKTVGDQLGGTRVGYKGALTGLYTNAGWSFELDDTGKFGTLTSPNGVVIRIDDNTGKVFLGAVGLGSSNAVMTQEDVLNAFNAYSVILKNWAAANFQTGSSTPVQPGSPTVTGSTVVFAKD